MNSKFDNASRGDDQISERSQDSSPSVSRTSELHEYSARSDEYPSHSTQPLPASLVEEVMETHFIFPLTYQCSRSGDYTRFNTDLTSLLKIASRRKIKMTRGNQILRSCMHFKMHCKCYKRELPRNQSTKRW